MVLLGLEIDETEKEEIAATTENFLSLLYIF